MNITDAFHQINRLHQNATEIETRLFGAYERACDLHLDQATKQDAYDSFLRARQYARGVFDALKIVSPQMVEHTN